MLFEISRDPVSNTSINNTIFLKQQFVSKQFMWLEPNLFLVFVYLHGFVPETSKANDRKIPTADSSSGPLVSIVLTPYAKW